MEIYKNIIIPLGYGKYVRSDKIIALDPIEDNRGPGRRTLVYVEGVHKPLIASRTEISILASLSKTSDRMSKTIAAIELLEDILYDIEQIGPMLRNSILEEAGLDLNKIEMKIREILAHDPEE